MREGIVVIAGLCMPVICQSQIPGSQPPGHLLNLSAVSVITDIDMDFPFIRILQESTCIDRLVQKLRGFIVGGDEYIYIREQCIRHIRQRDFMVFTFHPAHHQLDHATSGHDFRCRQHYSCPCLQDSRTPRDRKENPPDQVHR